MDNSKMTAVFIDGDWLYYAARRLKEEVDYSRLLTTLNDSFGLETHAHIFFSVDPQRKEQREFVGKLASLGYLLHTFKLIRRKDRYGNVTLGSKGLDVALAVSAMALLDDFHTLVLLTGDSDFVPLVQQIRAKNREVILITVPLASRDLVQAAGKHYVNLDTLLRNLHKGKGIPGIKGKQSKAIPPKNMYVEKGEHFAPYLAVRQLFLSAKREIVLIDPYVDDQVLQMIPLVPKSIRISILSNRISPADFCIQLKKLLQEGYDIKLYKTKTFHDRFLGIDDKWWHSGHSFKDLGGKDSFLSQMDDEVSVKQLQKRIHAELGKGKEYCT
jgi:uncharacterized LabA/DUF88 family protein